MESYDYRVAPQLIPPVVSAMGLGIFLLLLEARGDKAPLLLVILAPFFYLGVEILARRIAVDDTGLTIHKFLRSKRMQWSRIEYLGAVNARHKVFLILQDQGGETAMITNTVQSFKDLVHKIMERTPKDKIEENTAEILSAPPSKYGPTVQAWIVCFVFMGLLAGKFLGYG